MGPRCFTLSSRVPREVVAQPVPTQHPAHGLVHQRVARVEGLRGDADGAEDLEKHGERVKKTLADSIQCQ